VLQTKKDWRWLYGQMRELQLAVEVCAQGLCFTFETRNRLRVVPPRNVWTGPFVVTKVG